MKRNTILPAALVLMGIAVFLGLMAKATARITVETAAEPVKPAMHVLIDAGHGGEDGGAVCGDIREKQINLAISNDLADLLRLCGFDVSQTRSTDSAVTDEGESVRERKYNDMKKRLALYNASPDNVVLSIHQNKYPAESPHGAQVFFSKNHEKSAALAENVRHAVTSLLQPDNTRECKAAGKDIYLLNNANVPAVLVECGFISNPQERALLVTDEYQKQMALAIATGFINYNNTN